MPIDRRITPMEQDISNSSISIQSSRQFTALAKKAIAYQGRQTFTNVCCIFACPCLMILIAGTLGSLIAELISSTTTPYDYLHCSNVSVMSPANIPYWTSDSLPSFPFVNANESTLPGITQDKLYFTSYGSVSSSTTSFISSKLQVPCVRWFGVDYPDDISIYERPANISGGRISKLARDASYLPQPVSSWLSLLSLQNTSIINATTQFIFSKAQMQTWMYIGFDSQNVQMSDIGEKPMQTPISLFEFATLSDDKIGPLFLSQQNTSAGLLNTIPTRFYTSFTDGSVYPVPYYNFTQGPLGGTGDDIDDLISSSLNGIIQNIAKLDKSALFGFNLTLKNQLYAKANLLTANLTHGGIYFKKINHDNKSYAWNYHVGNSKRLRAVVTWPNPGIRMLLQQIFLSNAILRTSNRTFFGNSQITQGFRLFPQIDNTKLRINVAGPIGVVLFPFGVSFLLPIFALVLIQEKELRILIMMKMNGMKEWTYYLSHYITFTILYWISILVFILVGMAMKISLFTLTDRAVLLLIFFIWGNNLISLSFFFASFFSRTRFALTIIFLFVLCSVIISLALFQIFSAANGVPIPQGFFLWPPFAFYRALGNLNRATFSSAMIPYNLSMLVPGDEVWTCMMFMIAEIPIFLFLAYYLELVLPSEFGVRLPWYFPIKSAVKAITDWRFKQTHGGVDKREEEMATAIQIDEAETKFEDQDVKNERERVLNRTQINDDEYPLIMRNMRKVYAGRGEQGPKLAVKDVTFAVEEGLIFGLLGPNGAGKTTLISILTGLYEASAGEAKIAGFNVKTDSDQVYKKIGICPQFDIQWDDLTVGEHLLFYARLKGIIADDEDRAIQEALEAVSLTAFRNRLTKGLSGGERRRVSIAIALLGSPKVIFFDEPTTGLDPEVRRLIWNIVQRSKIGKTIVLTTHSMEEAEALCQRIGIMAKGTLRCYAPATRLKHLYGPGYKIFINTLPQDTNRACKFLESFLPDGWKKVDSFDTNTSYEFPHTPGIIGRVFAKMLNEKNDQGILDWGIGETSLEEIFLKLISETDASAEY